MHIRKNFYIEKENGVFLRAININDISSIQKNECTNIATGESYYQLRVIMKNGSYHTIGKDEINKFLGCMDYFVGVDDKRVHNIATINPDKNKDKQDNLPKQCFRDDVDF